MGAGHDEGVAVEHRAVVEKSDEGRFVQDHVSRDVLETCMTRSKMHSDVSTRLRSARIWLRSP